LERRVYSRRFSNYSKTASK